MADLNEQSAWRIELSREISKRYERQAGVRMTAVGGSASRGQADEYSDIDFAVY
ncbi:MAG: nucleotidyltransferase domain-containing protein [Tepidiformaceae bacterium]